VSIVETIDQIAREFSRQQGLTACECKHVNAAHDGQWGPCHGRHGSLRCPCNGFKGFNWNRYFQLVRFAHALLFTLGYPVPKEPEMFEHNAT